jgi:alanine racemase
VTRPTRAVVDLGAIARNFRRLKERVGDCALIPVVKADAYGHGAAPVARRLADEGADRFAVAIAEEGIALRRAGLAGEVLLLNHSDPFDLPAHRAYGLTPALYDLPQARGFADRTRALADPVSVHLKLDTGMGRLGFQPEQLGELTALLRAATGLRVTGTFTNFASADEPSSPATDDQLQRMHLCLEALRAGGVNPGLVHVANSAATLSRPDTWFGGVRPGLSLYGVSPFAEPSEEQLEPAMTVETEVMSVRDLPAGAAIGYGGRFRTRRSSRIAAIPIGYSDGIRRSFSERVSLPLRGRRAPIVGAVSMDVTLLDATDSGAATGDRVVCLGGEPDARVSAWELARAAGTIPYEILCGISSRVPRRYAG